MGDILIRNLDEGVIAAWKRRADANGRSLQAELHAELSNAVKAQQKAELIEQLRAFWAKIDMSKLDRQGWELIRDDRDER
jgi:plasmid stability protein